MKMNKREWLFLANKGKVQYKDLEFEVTLCPDSDGDEIINITLFPANEYSSCAYFGNGWVKYYEDKDFDELLPAMKKAADKMKWQADIVNSDKVLKLTDLQKEDNHCNHLLKGIDDKRIYVIQYIKNKDGDITEFQVLTGSRWSGGIEPDSPININIELDGVPYMPIWNFWLNGAIYKIKEEKDNA